MLSTDFGNLEFGQNLGHRSISEPAALICSLPHPHSNSCLPPPSARPPLNVHLLTSSSSHLPPAAPRAVTVKVSPLSQSVQHAEPSASRAAEHVQRRPGSWCTSYVTHESAARRTATGSGRETGWRARRSALVRGGASFSALERGGARQGVRAGRKAVLHPSRYAKECWLIRRQQHDASLGRRGL